MTGEYGHGRAGLGSATCDDPGHGQAVIARSAPTDEDQDHAAGPVIERSDDRDDEPMPEDPGGALPELPNSYLRAIGHTPLLTPAGEVELAQRVEQGDTAAANSMAQASLRLVVGMARRYSNRGLPLEDLIAEGNIGLLRPVQKYEWQRGYRFSPYAMWWRVARHAPGCRPAPRGHARARPSNRAAGAAQAAAADRGGAPVRSTALATRQDSGAGQVVKGGFMMTNEVTPMAAHEGEDERAFMQRVLVDSTATGAALSVAQRGYLARWHTQGWWTYDGMSLRNGHLTEDGRTALHERVGGWI